MATYYTSSLDKPVISTTTLIVDYEPTCVIDKIMQMYGVKQFVLGRSFNSSSLSTSVVSNKDNFDVSNRVHMIPIYISYKLPDANSSIKYMIFENEKENNYMTHVQMHLKSRQLNEMRCEMMHEMFKDDYMSRFSSSSSHLSCFNDDASMHTPVTKRFIDNAFENASQDGVNIYMSMLDNDLQCVWPAFHTRDQANILLDLKLPLA